MSDENLIQPKYPVPESVSQAARDFLALPIDMSGARRPVPSSVEEWEAMIAEANDMFGPLIAELAAASPITINKREIAGVTVRDVVPENAAALRQGVVLLNLHGGGYTQFGGDMSIMESIGMASAGFHVVAVDYRMPPHHPHPAAVNDGVAVYRALLDEYQPSQIAIYGASAGGGLSAAVILAARDQGLPLPAAVVMNTPWTDLDKIGDSYFTNDGVDPTLPSYNMLEGAARIYANGVDLKDPLLSPVYGDFAAGFPPALLYTGTRDLLLSCTVRMHRRLRNAGIEADLHVLEAMWHGFSLMVPEEGADMQHETVAFLEKHLGLAADDK